MKLQRRCRLLLCGVLGWMLLFFYFSWGTNSHFHLLPHVAHASSIQHSNQTVPTASGENESSRERREQALTGEFWEILDEFRNRGTRFRKPLDVDFEYFSEGSQAVHGLWEGRVSDNMLDSRLKEAKNNYVGLNIHNVKCKGSPRKQQGIQDLMCHLKQQKLRTVDGSEEPFAGLGWRKLVPVQPLQQLPGAPYRTCAVVTSAGALLRSSLGKEIDSHDAVLRFNAAPTQSFENHVGRKTTIRIINSQILAGPQHNFTSSSLYENITLVAWDPTSYSSTLSKWYSKPDYDLFTAYVKRRKLSPSQPFYILHPGFIWSLWDVLQSNMDEDIQPNPPSSGFIGIVIMLNLCDQVDVYEFIPSKRHTSLCHYFDQYHDMACTLGAYHPLLYEKLLVRKLTRTPANDLSRNGKAVLSGFSQITCQS